MGSKMQSLGTEINPVGLTFNTFIAALTLGFASVMRRAIVRVSQARTRSSRAGKCASGLCPKCEYSIRGLPVGPDNAARCTECGEVIQGHELPSAEV